MFDIINLHFTETLNAARGCCWLLAHKNFHVTPMKISWSHWSIAAWTSKENSGKTDRGAVGIIFLSFWESGELFSLDYPWNKKNIRLKWLTSLRNAFNKRDRINNSQNAIMSKYWLQFAHLSKILKLKFPVFQHKRNFHKREEYFWSCRFIGFHARKLFSDCLNVIHFYKTIFNKIICG